MKCMFVNQGFFSSLFTQMLVLISDCLCPSKSNYRNETSGKNSSKWVGCCNFKCMLVGGRAVCCQALKFQPVNLSMHFNHPVTRIYMSELSVKASTWRKVKLTARKTQQHQRTAVFLSRTTVKWLKAFKMTIS